MQLVGAPIILVIEAVSFVMSAVSRMLIRAPQPEPAVAGQKEDKIRRFRDGFVVVLDGRLWRTPVGTPAINNQFLQWIITLFALFAVRDLGMGAGTIGLVASCGAAGAPAGSLVTDVAIRRLGAFTVSEVGVADGVARAGRTANQPRGPAPEAMT